MHDYILLAMSLNTYGEQIFPVEMAGSVYFLTVNFEHVAVVDERGDMQNGWNLFDVLITVCGVRVRVSNLMISSGE